MDRSLLARRYALALFEYAGELGRGEQVARQMKLLNAVWLSVPGLRKALISPALTLSEKQHIFSTAVGIGSQDDLLVRFFQLIARYNRFGLLGRMAREYTVIWNERHKIVRAELETVSEVGEQLSAQLEELVRRAVGEDKLVEFSRKYDSELIGGFIIQVEDLRIDASVKKELELLKMNLLQ